LVYRVSADSFWMKRYPPNIAATRARIHIRVARRKHHICCLVMIYVLKTWYNIWCSKFVDEMCMNMRSIYAWIRPMRSSTHKYRNRWLYIRLSLTRCVIPSRSSITDSRCRKYACQHTLPPNGWHPCDHVPLHVQRALPLKWVASIRYVVIWTTQWPLHPFPKAPNWRSLQYRGLPRGKGWIQEARK